MGEGKHQTIKFRSFDGGISQIECHSSCTSTAALAKAYAIAGYPDRYVVFSREQTEIGYQGEKLSDGQSAKGLFLSCILRPSMFPSQAGQLRILSSVALITALEEHTTKKLGISWVSDIFCEGRRIGGVNIEGKLDNYSSYEYIIVTFSVKLTEKNFPPRLSDMLKKVFESENSSLELILAKAILTKFYPLYFNIRSSAKFMDIYKMKFLLRGYSAKYVKDGKRIRCKVQNIDPDTGALLLQFKDGKVISVSTPTFVQLPKRLKAEK